MSKTEIRYQVKCKNPGCGEKFHFITAAKTQKKWMCPRGHTNTYNLNQDPIVTPVQRVRRSASTVQTAVLRPDWSWPLFIVAAISGALGFWIAILLGGNNRNFWYILAIALFALACGIGVNAFAKQKVTTTTQ